MTYYGIADGKRCLQGKEVSRADLLMRLKNEGLSDKQLSLLDRKSGGDERFAMAAEKILEAQARKKIIQVLTPMQREALIKFHRAASRQDATLQTRPERVSHLNRVSELYKDSATAIDPTGITIFPPQVAMKYKAYLESVGRNKAVKPIEIDDRVVEAIWTSLPFNIRRDMIKRGVPPEDVKNSYADLNDRGKMMLKKYLSTGFRDEITGQPYSWRELSPDHIVPLTYFRNKGLDIGKAEDPDNLMLVHRGFNTKKGIFEGKAKKAEDPLGYTRAELLKEYSRQASSTQKEFEERIRGIKDRKDAEKARVEAIRDNSLLWGPREWREHIGGLRAGELQEIMKQFTPEGANPTIGRDNTTRHISKGAPKYPSPGVMRAAILLNRGIPYSQWPPKVKEQALNQFRLDLAMSILLAKKTRYFGTRDSQEREYVAKLRKYIGEGRRLPSEFVSILRELGIK